MLKTISIIDLLCKISKGEEIPEYVKYLDRLNEKYEIMYCCKENIIYKLDQTVILLTDEVEIMEEQNEIEYPLLHKIGENKETGDKMPNQEYLIDCNFIKLNKAICKLIDEVNKLKEEK